MSRERHPLRSPLGTGSCSSDHSVDRAGYWSGVANSVRGQRAKSLADLDMYGNSYIEDAWPDTWGVVARAIDVEVVRSRLVNPRKLGDRVSVFIFGKLPEMVSLSDLLEPLKSFSQKLRR